MGRPESATKQTQKAIRFRPREGRSRFRIRFEIGASDLRAEQSACSHGTIPQSFAVCWGAYPTPHELCAASEGRDVSKEAHGRESETLSSRLGMYDMWAFEQDKKRGL